MHTNRHTRTRAHTHEGRGTEQAQLERTSTHAHVAGQTGANCPQGSPSRCPYEVGGGHSCLETGCLPGSSGPLSVLGWSLEEKPQRCLALVTPGFSGPLGPPSPSPCLVRCQMRRVLRDSPLPPVQVMALSSLHHWLSESPCL